MADKKPAKGKAVAKVDAKPEDAEGAATAAAARSSKAAMQFQTIILGFAFLACGLAFLPTTLILFFGLMPTFAALVIDPTPDRIKTMAVGAMNIAGCIPFLLLLWTGGNGQSVEEAFKLITQPQTLITIYSCAAGGYLIFYTVSGLVSGIMLQSGKSRYEEVHKRMHELERKWGREVTGALPLDERGFPEDVVDDLTNES